MLRGANNLGRPHGGNFVAFPSLMRRSGVTNMAGGIFTTFGWETLVSVCGVG